VQDRYRMMVVACRFVLGNARLPLAIRSVHQYAVHQNASRAAEWIHLHASSIAEKIIVQLCVQQVVVRRKSPVLSAKPSVVIQLACWSALLPSPAPQSAQSPLANSSVISLLTAHNLNARWSVRNQLPVKISRWPRSFHQQTKVSWL
jgi:hypothetical protein